MTDADIGGSPALQRQPIQWRDCAGWIHHAPGYAVSDVVAVICSGVGRDSSTGYRPARFLADRLAHAGYSTIRFSYPGTGDSLDPDEDNYWPAWVRSVHSAIDLALTFAPARRVVLIGVRMGAAMAAFVASERPEAVGLVLLEPVVRGSSFATQLRMEERISTNGNPSDSESVRVHGLRLEARALGEMAKLDLRSLKLGPDRSVLVLSDSTSAVLRGCEESWRSQGVDVVRQGADAISAFFRPTHLADEPFPDVLDLTDWVQARFPISAGSPSAGPALNQAMLNGSGWTETAHFFSGDAHLFGVLCQPVQPSLSDTVVIIANGGGDPHDGFARFNVDFARRLARRGVASFRMDFAGLGDSINSAGDPDGLTHTFTVDRKSDFASAADFVWAKGFRKIALQGLCSGAYHAFQAAVDEPRVSVLFCVNLPWFSLRHEKPGPASFAQRGCASLASRGVRCLLMYAQGDAGLKPLEQQFGRSGRDFVAQAGFEVAIRPDIDHDLTRPEMQHLAADQMMMFLFQEPPVAEPAMSGVRHLITEGVP